VHRAVIPAKLLAASASLNPEKLDSPLSLPAKITPPVLFITIIDRFLVPSIVKIGTSRLSDRVSRVVAAVTADT